MSKILPTINSCRSSVHENPRLKQIKSPFFSFSNGGQRRGIATIEQKLEEFKIIPEVLSSSPSVAMVLLFKSGVKVNLGNRISFYQSKTAPYLFYWPVDKFETLHTVMMLDIDFPSQTNPTDRSYLIFLVCNVHANDIMKGDIIAEYEPIQPAKDTGQHRVVILGFKQSSCLKIQTKIKGYESRLKFSINDFIQQYNLQATPVVGNFFICSG